MTVLQSMKQEYKAIIKDIQQNPDHIHMYDLIEIGKLNVINNNHIVILKGDLCRCSSSMIS